MVEVALLKASLTLLCTAGGCSEVVSFPFPFTVHGSNSSTSSSSANWPGILSCCFFWSIPSKSSFLCVLSWLCFMVPQHSWEWRPSHIWGEGEICVFWERFDIITCHRGTSQPTCAGPSCVTVGGFAYCLISDAVFQECALRVNQKQCFSNG